MEAAARSALIVYDSSLQVRIGNRRCASWYPAEIIQGKKIPAHIRLNDECASLAEEERPFIALHEILGVSKELDRNYEISSEIMANTQILTDKTAHKISIMRKENSGAKFASGGSTVVGGGGDFDDLLFKVAGFRYLQARTPGEDFYGIPVSLLKIAIKYMKVTPATDISTDFELRRSQVEGDAANLYVRSSLYRSRDTAELGLLAIQAARLYILFAPDEIHLAKVHSDSLLDGNWYSPLLELPYMTFPEGKDGFITWINESLLSGLTEVQRKRAFDSATTQGALARTNPAYKKMRQYSYVVKAKEDWGVTIIATSTGRKWSWQLSN